MKQVFTPCTGAVQVTRPGCSEGDFLTITIDTETLTQSFIVTGVALEMVGNYQFLHTVNDFVYFYAFGDRVGTLRVSGVSFIKNCLEVEKRGARFIEPYNYYMANRAAQRGGRAVTITLATPDKEITFYGFLVGIRMEAADNQMGPIGHWTMRFDVLPQKQKPPVDFGAPEFRSTGGVIPNYNPTTTA
jgi:hypothetical protein